MFKFPNQPESHMKRRAVLVQGSYHPKSRPDTPEQLKNAEDFARALGKELMEADFDLLVTGTGPIDSAVGRAASARCDVQGHDPFERIRIHIHGAPPSDFVPFGMVNYSGQTWKQIRTRVVNESDVVIALLGGTGTVETIEKAQVAKKLLAPVAIAGGAGLTEWKRLNRSGYYHIAPGDIDFLGDVYSTPADLATRLVKHLRDVFDNTNGIAAAGRSKKDVSRARSGIAVFVSHSSADADLASALVRLIEKSLLLANTKIRCTSIDGYRLEGGSTHVTELRRELVEAEVFMGLLTKASLSSEYVLFEMGARWGVERQLTPVLGKGLNAEDLAGPLSSLTAHDATSRGHLHQLLDELAQRLKLELQKGSAYVQEIDKVLELARPTHDSGRRVAPTPAPVDVPAPPGNRTRGTVDRQQLQVMCSRIAARYDDDFFVHPHITPARLRNGKEGLRLKAGEDVIAFVFNSRRHQDGVAFLEKGIVWRNNKREPVHQMTYQQLAGVQIIADNGEDEVRVGPVSVIDLSGSDVEPSDLASLLRRLARLASA